jgi:hypothetical protein
LTVADATVATSTPAEDSGTASTVTLETVDHLLGEL